MFRLLMAATAIVLIVPASYAADATELKGNYRLAQVFSAIGESRLALIKIETKDGKPSATVIDTMSQVVGKGKDPTKLSVKIDSLKVDGDRIELNLTIANTNKQTFEGTIDSKDPKAIRGTLGDSSRVSRATLTAQDGDELKVMTAAERPKAPEPYLAAQKLTSAPTQFQLQAQRSMDANEKAELLAKVKAARAEADEKVPGLYRETVEKNADSPYAVEAATQLMRTAGKSKASPADVEKWIKIVDADAARYGKRIAAETAVTLTEQLNGQKGYEMLALASATKGAASITEKSAPSTQSRVLKALKTAQLAAGKTDDAKMTDARLVKVEALLDDEFIKTYPIHPPKFAGRKDSSANRVAVMELFTGATCPPCVAADIAFDALIESYEPKDLVLIQYHMHIPGPDTLTNPDTIARWDYYRAKFPEGIRGVPSSLFNGKPLSGGGGGKANGQSKYDAYTGIINDLLDLKTDVMVTGSAKRAGDKINMSVGVDGVSGDNVVLRVMLVEEKVKYPGSNGMRFHHQVVRGFAGGPKGVELKDKSTKKTFDMDLGEVRKDLTKHLDEFGATRPFPNPDRPMEMSHLKVIALVQNDATGEILNAAEFPVSGK